jgi:hypothetical protein
MCPRAFDPRTKQLKGIECLKQIASTVFCYIAFAFQAFHLSLSCSSVTIAQSPVKDEKDPTTKTGQRSATLDRWQQSAPLKTKLN